MAGAHLDSYETVTLHRRGGELRIELNRPGTMNAWDRQLGVDLLAAVERRSTTPPAPWWWAPGAPRAPTSRRASTPRPSSPRRRHGAARPLPPDHHRDPPHAQARGGRRQRTGGHRLSLALACDLVIAKESAYFLLANISLGARRRLVAVRPHPDRPRPRDGDGAMLAERPSRRRRSPTSTASSPTTPSPARSTALAARLAAGPTSPGRGAPQGQPAMSLAAAWEQPGARGVHPADGRLRRLHRGRERLPRQAPGRVQGRSSVSAQTGRTGPNRIAAHTPGRDAPMSGGQTERMSRLPGPVP